MAPSDKGLKGLAVMAFSAGAFLMALVLAGNPTPSAQDLTQVSNHSTIEDARPLQAVSAGESGSAQPTGVHVTLPTDSGGGVPTPTDFPFGRNVRVWNDPNNQSRPSMVVNSTGTIFIAFQNHNRLDWDVYITSSTDDGHTWNTPIALANTTANETNPSLAVNSRGAYALFYQQDGFADRLYFFQSTDGILWRQGFWSLAGKPGLSDPQLPSVAAQNPSGTYPDGIMVAVQVQCVHPTNCFGGSDTAYWVGSRTWSSWPPVFDLANWYWGNPGGIPPQFLRPSISWSDAALYQVLENATIPGTKWSLIVLTMFENGSGLLRTFHSWVNSTASIYPRIAADGVSILVGGSYVNATLFPSNPSNHNARYFFSANAGASYSNGTLDSSSTNQLSLSVAGKGSEWHLSYYSDYVMTHQSSYDSMTTLSGPQKVSDSAGTAASDVLSTAVYLGNDGVPRIAWQDDRDGDFNIYFASNLTYQFWINASCGGADANLNVVIDGAIYRTPLTGFWTPGSLHLVEVFSVNQPSGPCKRCVFRGWSDGGGTSHVVNATSEMSLVAEFDDAYLVQLDEVPPLPLLNVTWNGTSYQGPTQLFERPGTHTAIVPIPQVTAPDVRYNFTRWSDGDLSNPRSVVVPGLGAGCVNLTAMFAAEYLLTVTSSPPGLVVGHGGVFGTAPLSFWTVEGSLNVFNTSSPQADPGGSPELRHRFDAWIGGPPTLTWAVMATGPGTYMANFVKQIRMTIVSNVPGPLFNVTGADCGIGLPAPGPLTCWVDEGTTATIEALPPIMVSCRMIFISWSDGFPMPVRPASPLPPNATYLAIFETWCNVMVGIDPLSCWDAGPPNTALFRMSEIAMIVWRPPTGLPPYERYRFAGWVGTGLGSYTGPDPVANVTVLDDITETAYCHHEFETIIDTTPIAIVFYYVDDVNYTGRQTFWWLNQTTHWLNVTVTTQMASVAGTRYVFIEWNGVDVSPLPHHPPFVVSASTVGTRYLSFRTQYQVTLVSPSKGNLRCLENSDCWYDASAPATINVTTPWPSGAPSIRYAFQHWMGDASGTDTDLVVQSVSAPMTIGAEWAEEYKLGVLTDQSTFSCWPENDCWFLEGTSANVSLADSVVPGPTGTRWLFDGWTGDASGIDPFPLVMNSPKNITAIWRTQYQLTVTSTCGANAGCGALFGGGWFNASTLVSLSVTTPWTDSTGKVWDFDHWGGDANGSQATTIVNMDGPKNVLAVWRERSGESPWVLLIGLVILAVGVVLLAIILLLRARRRKKGEESKREDVEETESPEADQQTPP